MSRIIEGKYWVYGRHSAVAAIQNPKRKIHNIMVTANAQRQLAEILPPNVEVVNDRKITHEIANQDAVHQGVAVLVEAFDYGDNYLAKMVKKLGKKEVVIMLDQVTDPHNVGAIMRSASAFGAAALITTFRNSPAESGVLAKSASGALEYVPYVRIRNLSDSIATLKAAGFWIVGLDGEAEENIAKLGEYEKLAIVMGAEGKGMRQKTRDYCDLTVKIPITSLQESLNVSNAAAIALYEASKQVNI